MNWRSLKMKVFSMSKPRAIISLAFSTASLCASSIFKSFHKNFSSSVSWITSGTLKVSCSHLRNSHLDLFAIFLVNPFYLVNMKGIKWPKCKASELGPLPVYKKKGFPCSYIFRMVCMSRWEKKTPLFRRWWAGLPVTFSNLSMSAWSILELPNLSKKMNNS